jgi:mutual gliding-motility protein MglA
MPLVDHAHRRITVKLVLCGAGGAGKTTCLTWLHSNLPADSVGSLTSLSTRHERTLFFDFMPVDAGRVGAYEIVIHLYTVPGQPRFREVRQSVLQGADGIAHVIDSQRDRLDDNHEAMRDLHEALAEQGVDSRALPTVMLFNKRDLPHASLATPEELSIALNYRSVPEYRTSAVRGIGLVDALRGLSGLVLHRLGVGARPASGSMPSIPVVTPANDAILPVITPVSASSESVAQPIPPDVQPTHS